MLPAHSGERARPGRPDADAPGGAVAGGARHRRLLAALCAPGPAAWFWAAADDGLTPASFSERLGAPERNADMLQRAIAAGAPTRQRATPCRVLLRPAAVASTLASPRAAAGLSRAPGPGRPAVSQAWQRGTHGLHRARMPSKPSARWLCCARPTLLWASHAQPERMRIAHLPSQHACPADIGSFSRFCLRMCRVSGSQL